ncbi:hypothetical protein [Corynebacterium glyciniphilum]|uniref:hypothetical protein n=1 Tax=Corynebacterium glyciniphilum TaxID=1404244 RepID=UPI003FD3B32E
MTEDQPSLFDLRVPIGDLEVGDAFSHSGWDLSVITERTATEMTYYTTDTVNGRRVGVTTTTALHRVVERR